MIKNLIIILILILNYIQCKHKRQISFPEDDEEGCTTPNGGRGICEPLVRCDDLLSNRNLKLLRQSICGFDDNVPKVCCPLSKQMIKPTTKRPPKRRSTTTTTTVPTIDEIPDELGDQPSEDMTVSEKPQKLPEFCGNTSIISDTRIVGGKVSRPGSWPWMAAIFIEDSGQFVAQCGGALISDQEIITASHCVVESGRVLDSNRVKIRLGEHNILKRTKDDAEMEFTVIKITHHKGFEPKTYRNDIAIIKLSKKVPFNRRVWPICLPFDTTVLNSEENIGRSGYITGWGRLAFNGKSSEVLREAQIEIISNKECGKSFEKIVKITDEYLCAGTVGSTKDSCQGDSGGPLIQIDPQTKRYYLTGVVSFGRRCATPGFPGVYTRVSYFLNWISNHI